MLFTSAYSPFPMRVSLDAPNYSETRVAAPRKHNAKWLFPQEKAASRTLGKGTFTLVSL
jgi:hypothetical protein